MALLKRIAGAAGAGLALGYVWDAASRRLLRPFREAARGRFARTPLDMTWLGWKDVVLRFAGNVADNRLSSLAGAVAFFTLLSLVPALSLFVTIYRYFTDPLTIANQLDDFTAVFPQAARDLIHEQAMRLATQTNSTLSWTFIVSLVVAAWSANAAVKAVFDALNIIYREREKRSFLRLNLISLLTTLSGVVLLAAALIVIAIVPLITALFPFELELQRLLSLVRWPAFFVVAVLSIACLYWIGPSRRLARFVWVLPGALAAALLWAGASFAFSWYVGTLGNYTATYGSLATIVVFMTWLWLSAWIVLAGAEFNAELEHQTARDSTIGRPKPLGRRGATMADTIGPAIAEE
ncbi:YihY/virulence factor BrkB family protein [Bosea caraganae]|uniref:YihY/virulence factor BrkB family protein n=1 Tax=Bosea caraganae TaxID=2763117 RepID=A0A370L8R8_9HYPH|nr:YihY/virulence factor BrkB family protein [Bosea caraganae]RDJ26781.1 YihY/virulence factor BrkB family protein [Bosea caraganae]RDJ30668.1 YihY/virulence factor BrkB family protein [Bosea caraganae]